VGRRFIRHLSKYVENKTACPPAEFNPRTKERDEVDPCKRGISFTEMPEDWGPNEFKAYIEQLDPLDSGDRLGACVIVEEVFTKLGLGLPRDCHLPEDECRPYGKLHRFDGLPTADQQQALAAYVDDTNSPYLIKARRKPKSHNGG